ncbi:MAG TPA: hypothetical protein VF251_13495 [Pyrinomonadaceae bacterium]
MDEPPRDELVLQILRYVVANPTAKDTVHGIEKWWLSKSLSSEARTKMEQHLNVLVAKGWLIGRRSPQSEMIYSLNANGLAEINEFLARGH